MKTKTLSILSFGCSGAFRKLILAGGLGVMMLTQASVVVLAGPTLVATNGSWVQFRWALGNQGGPFNAIENPLTFSVSSGNTGIMDVTDYALPGDRFKLTDSVSGMMWETTVPFDFNADESDPDVAFSRSQWSSGTFNLVPGSYSIDIEVTQQTTQANEIQNGAGFLRVNLASAVPEPGATLWLLGVGLLGGLRRRR